MKVILTNDPQDRGTLQIPALSDCDCVCDCACPVEGMQPPVLSLPVAYYLELTYACPNRCPGCGNLSAADMGGHAAGERSAARPAPLDGAGWRALIARLADHAQQLKITGGEPTCHPAFDEIIRAVAARELPFTLFTAARWPDPQAILDLLQETEHCEGLLISLHGPDAATHEAFTATPGAFDETVANIRRAVAAGLPVALSLVINRHNWDRISETLTLAAKLGVNHLVCNRMLGAPPDDLALSASQLRAAIATIEELRAAGHAIRFGNCIPQCFAASSSTGCTAGRTFATIDPWGRMRPCNHAPLIAGDLRTESVAAVWRGATMQRWRALIPSACESCAAFARCRGGCRAQALLTGRESDPLMRAPLTGFRSPETLRLYAGLRPILHGQPRREPGDALLITHRGRAVGVPAELTALPAHLDGGLTLAHIAARYGQGALHWIGALHRQSFVRWA
jgi:AdoMet-dependent heme synthase